MSKTLNTRIKHAYKLSTEWTQNNPVLLEGELGIESDTLKFKIGNGTLSWTELSYSIFDNIEIKELIEKVNQNIENIENLDTNINNKIDKNQDTANAGKILGINDEGEVVPIESNDNFLNLKNLPWILLDLSTDDKSMGTLDNGQYVVIKGGKLYGDLRENINNKENLILNVGDLVFKTNYGTNIISGTNCYYITDYTQPLSNYFYYTYQEHKEDLEKALEAKQDKLIFSDNITLIGRYENIPHAEFSQATETTIGGVKLPSATDNMTEFAGIDENGFIKVPAGGGSSTFELIQNITIENVETISIEVDVSSYDEFYIRKLFSAAFDKNIDVTLFGVKIVSGVPLFNGEHGSFNIYNNKDYFVLFGRYGSNVTSNAGTYVYCMGNKIEDKSINTLKFTCSSPFYNGLKLEIYGRKI